MAQTCDIPIYDLARDYGFGKAQKMLGEFGTADVFRPFVLKEKKII